MRSRFGVLLLTLVLGGGPCAAAAQSKPPTGPFEYDFRQAYELAQRIEPFEPDPEMLARIFERRRARVLQAIAEGALIVFSVEWVQPRRLEIADVEEMLRVESSLSVFFGKNR